MMPDAHPRSERARPAGLGRLGRHRLKAAWLGTATAPSDIFKPLRRRLETGERRPGAWVDRGQARLGSRPLRLYATEHGYSGLSVPGPGDGRLIRSGRRGAGDPRCRFDASSAPTDSAVACERTGWLSGEPRSDCR